jgi:hypothetical protein
MSTLPRHGDEDGPIPKGKRISQQTARGLFNAVSAVVSRCEYAFQSLGMAGPDRAMMGETWFDAYQLCRSALTKAEEELS